MLSDMSKQEFAVVASGVDAIEKDVGARPLRSRSYAVSQQAKRRLA